MLFYPREQLLNVLLRITTIVLNKKPPKRKGDTLSGKLAPAIFQVIYEFFSLYHNNKYKSDSL